MRFFLLAVGLAVSVSGGVSATAQNYIGTITDLPPAIHNGTRHEIKLIIHAAPASEVILQLCFEMSASCSVVGAPNTLIGYSCNGNAEICWRTFINSVQHSGISMIVQPSIVGASYVFYSGNAGDFNAPAGGAPQSAPADDSDGVE